MIDMLSGEGCPWSDVTMTHDEICDALETMTEDERFAMGFSAWHERKAWEREARARVASNWQLSMLRNFLTLAELDGDHAAASKYRMMIAAEELGIEAEATVMAVQSVGDLRLLIDQQSKISPA